MSQEQNKKTLRHFQCRDYLWEIFEQMSGELECSTDYLINEAMRQYARSRNYGARAAGASPTGRPSGPQHSMVPAAAPQASPAPSAPLSSPPVDENSATSPPPPQAQAVQRPADASGAIPRPVPRPSMTPARPSMAAPPPGAPRPASASYPGTLSVSPPASPQTPNPSGSYPNPAARISAPSMVPPPLPGAPRMSMPSPPVTAPQTPNPTAASATMQMPSLFVVFNGEKHPVAKEEFVIGRGSKTADLAIKDGNISRRHAAVVFQGGAFYMKDLGSTNGVEYQGRRVDSRKIEEGDVFQICDYQLRFTYR